MNNNCPWLNESKSIRGFVRKIFFLLGAAILFTQYVQSQDPRLVLPIGHTGSVKTAEFSPDGKNVLTTSVDMTAKIWDVESGKLLIDFDMNTGYYGMAFSAEFNNDGTKVVSVPSFSKSAIIWDAQSGNKLLELFGHKNWIQSAHFSPDGTKLVTASFDNTAIIWDFPSGELLKRLRGHDDGLYSAQFSPDGLKIVTSSFDKTAKIWGVKSGKLLASLIGDNNPIISAQFSPDGNKILTNSNSGNNHLTLKIWDAKNGELLVDLVRNEPVYSMQFSPDGSKLAFTTDDKSVKVCDTESGKIIKYLAGHKDRVGSSVFNSNGTRLVTASNDNTGKIWDIETGNLLNDLTGHLGSVTSIKFNRDGTKIVTASTDKTAKIWDGEKGKLLVDLTGHISGNYFTDLSPDGKKAVIKALTTAIIMDVETGNLLHELSGHSSRIWDSQFSPDGKKIITIHNVNIVTIYDVLKGNQLLCFTKHSGPVSSAQFSPDCSKIVTTSYDKTAKIWDSETGEVLENLTGHTEGVTFAQFNHDGTKIITTSLDNTTKIWNVETGDLLVNLIGHKGGENFAQFNTDETKIATASYDSTIKIWDASTGQLLNDIRVPGNYTDNVKFSPDGGKILSITADKRVFIWDIFTGKLEVDLKWYMGKGIEFSCNFMSDCRYLITYGEDEKTIIWDAATGKMLYTRLQLTNNDWLVYDEHYRYDGSPGAIDYLYFVCGLEIIDLKQLKDALYVPNLVERIMNVSEFNHPYKLSNLPICELPLVEQERDTVPGLLRFRIIERELELTSAEVYINNKLVWTLSSKSLPKNQNVYLLEMHNDSLQKHFIAGRVNKVEVIGVSEFLDVNLRSGGGQKPVFLPGDKEPVSLYAVLIGVNDYQKQSMNLGFPVKDAQDLGKTLELAAGKFFLPANIHSYHINSDVRIGTGYNTPEKESIRKAIEDISKKAKPQDVVLIYFAGHGEMIGEPKKYFTMLTAETSGTFKVGISTKDLQSWLSCEGPFEMKANKTILIIDACRSGQAIEDLLAWREEDDESDRIKEMDVLRSRYGVSMITASAADQQAYESTPFRQGLLTYSLLHTIKNAPDGFLDVNDWFDNTQKFLDQLAKRLDKRQEAHIALTTNFSLGKIDEEVRSSIHLEKERPVMVLGNIGDKVSFYDEISLKDQLSKMFSQFSDRDGKANFFFLPRSDNLTERGYLITIIYEINGQMVKCEVTLRYQGKRIAGFTDEGQLDNLGVLATKIVEKVNTFLSNIEINN